MPQKEHYLNPQRLLFLLLGMLDHNGLESSLVVQESHTTLCHPLPSKK